MLHGLDLYIATRTLHSENVFTDCKQCGQAVDGSPGADELVFISLDFTSAPVSQLNYLLTIVQLTNYRIVHICSAIVTSTFTTIGNQWASTALP